MLPTSPSADSRRLVSLAGIFLFPLERARSCRQIRETTIWISTYRRIWKTTFPSTCRFSFRQDPEDDDLVDRSLLLPADPAVELSAGARSGSCSPGLETLLALLALLALAENEN